MRFVSHEENIQNLSTRQMKVLRGVEYGVEPSVEDLAVDRYRCRGTKTSDIRDEARSIHQVSKNYRGSRNFLVRSTSCLGSVEIVIRKSLGSRQIGKCRRGIEKVSRQLKISFSRREKHIYECNQACYKTNDPNNILKPQNHLSTRRMSIT